MAYDPEQLHVARAIKRIGRRRGVGRKLIKANLETGIVESGLRNLSGGDADSAGYRQERASLYRNPRNLKAAINRFYDEALKLDHGQSAGRLAADVQRPAAQYRGRYGQASSEARSLLRGGSGGAGLLRAAQSLTAPSQADLSGSTASSEALLARISAPKSTPPVAGLAAPSFSAGVKLPNGYAGPASSGGGPAKDTSVASLLAAASAAGQAAASAPGPATSRTTVVTGGSGKVRLPTGRYTPHQLKGVKGTSTFEGKTVAAWIVPVLKYARKHGWDGSVASGYRSYAQQKAIYDSGVRPAAVPGTSNHEGDAFPRGAVDVNGAEQLAAILRRSPYRHLLVYAGAKDKVHFSHPHNGSY